MVVLHFNPAVEVFGFSPDQGWTEGSFNAEGALIGQPPFEDGPEQAINRVVSRFAFEVVLKAAVAFQGDDGHHAEFAFGEALRIAAVVVPGTGPGRRAGKGVNAEGDEGAQQGKGGTGKRLSGHGLRQESRHGWMGWRKGSPDGAPMRLHGVVVQRTALQRWCRALAPS